MKVDTTTISLYELTSFVVASIALIISIVNSNRTKRLETTKKQKDKTLATNALIELIESFRKLPLLDEDLKKSVHYLEILNNISSVLTKNKKIISDTYPHKDEIIRKIVSSMEAVKKSLLLKNMSEHDKLDFFKKIRDLNSLIMDLIGVELLWKKSFVDNKVIADIEKMPEELVCGEFYFSFFHYHKIFMKIEMTLE